MALMDILRNYIDNPGVPNLSVAHEHYDEVARFAPSEIVGHGLADAFRDPNTPSFGAMVRQLFGHSNPQQRAGVINQLLHSMAPAGVMALLGSILGRSSAPASGGIPQVTPEQAATLTPEQVDEIATRAQEDDPTAIDKIGGFYAQHPQLVKTLGSAALAVALAGVAKRMRRS
jgi:hypothetical protein